MLIPSSPVRSLRSAFTLMELLVVISVIMILAGMVFGGVTVAKRASQKAKSQSTLTQVMAALESYKQLNGVYPEKDLPTGATLPVPATQDWSAIFATGGGGGTLTPKAVSACTPDDWQLANLRLVSCLNANGESFPSTGIIDAWKHPLHYRPARFYPYTPASGSGSSTTTIRIDGDDPPSKDSYQLWSIGADGLDQYGAAGSDDMTSWTDR